MKTICELDVDGKLIAKREVDDTTDVGDALAFPGEVDLPADGSYRWDHAARAFEPAEQEVMERPGAPPAPAAYILHLALLSLKRRLDMDDLFPAEVEDWIAWYGEEQRAQDELRVARTRRAQRRARRL